jgi:hypothetical protein
VTQGIRGLHLLVGLVVSVGATIDGSASATNPSKAACLSASAAWADLREAHKLSSARDQLLVCAAASCPADIREECSRHIPEVSAAIPSIVFAARDGSGNDVAAVTVSMDGRPILTKLDGSSIAIDPGEHAFRFEAVGQSSVERKFVIQEGEKDRRERIELRALAPSEPSGKSTPASAPQPQRSSQVPAPAPGSSEPLPSTEASAGGLGGQKILGLVAGGVGVAGIAVGSAFGLMANSSWTNAKNACGSGCSPNAPAQTEKNDANGQATIATIGFIAGGVLVATGLALFFTAPKNSNGETAQWHLLPTVEPGAAGVTLAGAF